MPLAIVCIHLTSYVCLFTSVNRLPIGQCGGQQLQEGRLRITEVESFSVFAPGSDPSFIWRDGLRGSPPDREVAVIRLRTDEGVDGVALAPRRGAGPIVADAVEYVLRDELIGADPLQREWLWHRMWEIDRTEELPIFLLGLDRHRPLGSRRPVLRRAHLGSARRLSTRDPGIRIDNDLLEHRRVPRRHDPVHRARLPGAQAPCVGRRPTRRGAVHGGSRACRGRLSADVRRLGRIRPSGRRLRRRCARCGRDTSGTRSRCASSASRRTSGSRSGCGFR